MSPVDAIAAVLGAAAGVVAGLALSRTNRRRGRGRFWVLTAEVFVACSAAVALSLYAGSSLLAAVWIGVLVGAVTGLKYGFGIVGHGPERAAPRATPAADTAADTHAVGDDAGEPTPPAP